MKFLTKLFFISLTFFSFSQEMSYDEWQTESKSNIRLLPEYGGAKKSKEQKNADKEFIGLMMKSFDTKKEASDNMIETGFKYYHQGDLKTAMYRFNQAYLLDAKNSDIYYGYGAVFLYFGDYHLARKQYDVGLKLDSKNDKILVDYATTYLMELYDSQDLEDKSLLINKSIETLHKAYTINPKNSNASFKLSISYLINNECNKAKEYLEIAQNLGNQNISDDYINDLNKECGETVTDCTSVKVGKFSNYDEETGETIIERTEEFQVEENIKLDVKMKFKVTWINECTYELKAIENLKDPKSKDLPNMIVTCRITEVTKDGYHQVSSTDINSFVYESELIRID